MAKKDEAQVDVPARVGEPTSQAILIKRISDKFASHDFEMRHYTVVTEQIGSGNSVEFIRFIEGWVPLDCIDDHSKAPDYNPRKPRKPHRQKLMEEMGDYGLVKPLVGALAELPEESIPENFLPNEPARHAVIVPVGDERGAGKATSLYLLDGRHRYQGLLHLVPELREVVNTSHKAMNKGLSERNVAESEEFVEKASQPAIDRIRAYSPPVEVTDKGELMPMVPVKIYLSSSDVRRIGLAVFLNKGQKRLSGGEEVLKIGTAYETALNASYTDIVNRNADEKVSELKAVQQVAGSTSAAGEAVVLSWFAAKSMDPEGESPWQDLIAQYQGDDLEIKVAEEVVKARRPLTAQNFVAFIRPLIDAEPKPVYDEKQRTRERNNLDRLGQIFKKHFGWPGDIPSPKRVKHTATGQLCRSFLISAVGDSIGHYYKNKSLEGVPFLSQNLSIDSAESIWDDLDTRIANLARELVKQATIREEYEYIKEQFDKLRKAGADNDKLGEIVKQMDTKRGALWSMDTIKSNLQRFIEDHMEIVQLTAKEEDLA